MQKECGAGARAGDHKGGKALVQTCIAGDGPRHVLHLSSAGWSSPKLHQCRNYGRPERCCRQYRRSSRLLSCGIPKAWLVHDPQQSEASCDSAKAQIAWPTRLAAWGTGSTMLGLAAPDMARSWPWDAQSPAAASSAPWFSLPSLLPFWADYLLSHPFLTIGLAAGLYVVVPRLWRLFVRVVLVPLLGIAALVFALQHPSQTLAVGTNTYGFISTHPVVVSVGVLVFLAVTLSPYLLVVGFAAALFSGIPYVPGPLRPLIPGPLLQAETSLADFSARIRGQATTEAKDVATELDPAKPKLRLPEIRLPLQTMLVAPDMVDEHLPAKEQQS